ncbi:dTDP-4-dehydrorhamnose 3,5-epimerase, partial [Singulisphaera rosea]
MKIESTDLPGVVILEPPVYDDSRGYFTETWKQSKFAEAGLPTDFAQDNLSYSLGGVLRGLHYQEPHPQGKLIYVLQGEIFDVAVDIRPGSPTFRRWVGVTLSVENHRQVYIPPGFAHGFVVTSDAAMVVYKCTASYRPDCDRSVAWDDPELAIRWPVASPILSAKDQVAPRLADV